jgi:hypothetical protein
MLASGQVTELRALEATTASYGKPRTIFGYFDDPAKLAAAVRGIASAKGIYFTPNPVTPALLARAKNRLKDAGKSETSGDKDITVRRWMLIDCDAVRPAGISASESEHQAALECAGTIRAGLAERGWPEPIMADSGNGAHLLYRVDLSADEGELIENCLDALADQHGGAAVTVDRSVHNPARIWKLYGTMAAKGDSTAERPHRMARIIELPVNIAAVTRAQLEELAAQAPAKESPKSKPMKGHAPAGDSFAWLEAFIARNAEKLPPMTGPEPYEGGRRWEFEYCPWNPSEHRNRSAFLIQGADGRIGAGCRHNSCRNAGHNWQSLRAMIEPKAPPSPKSPLAVPEGGVSGIEVGKVAPDYVPFPVAVMPPALAELVSEGAAALGCDAAQIALPMVAACSAAVGNSRRIILKSSWIEPAAIWAVPVLPSGALKSPALDLALDPIRKAQAKAITGWRQEMEEYQARHDAWEDQKKNLRGPEPMPPVCARIVVSDTTVEALADRLQDAVRGLLCERDELSGWLNSFNQYKAKGGADVAHWLTMHRAGPLLMDRKTGDQKIIHAPRAFVALTGTIQPGVFRRALTPEYLEAGLAARLLVTMPPVKRRTWSEATVRESVKKRYAGTLAALMALPMCGAPMEPEPVDLPLTADAKRLWIDFYNAHNAAEQASDRGDLAAAWSKLEGYAARLALILHCVRAVNGEANAAAVDAVSMKAGIALARWFAREAERVYAMLSGDGGNDELAELRQYIRDHGGRITARELRDGPRRYRPDGAARDALCKLVEAGWARWITPSPGPRGGRPSEICELLGPGPETPIGAVKDGGFAGAGNGGDADESGIADAGEDDGDWSNDNRDAVEDGCAGYNTCFKVMYR